MIIPTRRNHLKLYELWISIYNVYFQIDNFLIHIFGHSTIVKFQILYKYEQCSTKKWFDLNFTSIEYFDRCISMFESDVGKINFFVCILCMLQNICSGYATASLLSCLKYRVSCVSVHVWCIYASLLSLLDLITKWDFINFMCLERNFTSNKLNMGCGHLVLTIENFNQNKLKINVHSCVHCGRDQSSINDYIKENFNTNLWEVRKNNKIEYSVNRTIELAIKSNLRTIDNRKVQ